MSDIKSRVNTYLYAAQTQAKQAETSTNAALAQAAVVGASLSLKYAWEAWLEELSAYLKIPADALQDESSELAQNMPDCQFLFAQKQEQGSWYQRLLALSVDPLLYRENSPHSRQAASTEASVPRIEVINLTETAIEGDRELTLLELVEEVKTYIQQRREQQTEW